MHSYSLVKKAFIAILRFSGLIELINTPDNTLNNTLQLNQYIPCTRLKSSKKPLTFPILDQTNNDEISCGSISSSNIKLHYNVLSCMNAHLEPYHEIIFGIAGGSNYSFVLPVKTINPEDSIIDVSTSLSSWRYPDIPKLQPKNTLSRSDEKLLLYCFDKTGINSCKQSWIQAAISIDIRYKASRSSMKQQVWTKEVTMAVASNMCDFKNGSTHQFYTAIDSNAHSERSKILIAL